VHSFDLYTHAGDQIIGDDYDKKKSIFVIAYQEGSVMEGKITKICNSFNGTTFSVKLEGIEDKIREC
jgi:ribulose 1,5-bisphosphate carboxylase large subunit-like protein